MKTRVLLLTALAAALAGCVSTEYTGPAKAGESPAHLKRVSVFGDQKASEVDLLNGTLKGYSSEQAQVAGAVTGAAVSAAIKSAKP
jgi:hypothetical protein